MKKIVFTLFVLSMSVVALTGCKAEGEIDPDNATLVAPAR